MGNITCVDAAKSFVEMANEQLSPFWKLDEESFSIFQKYCEAIDSMSEEFKGEYFNLSLDEEKLTVSITMDAVAVIIRQTNHAFFELAKRAVALVIDVDENNRLAIKFTFPSLWTRSL